MRRGRSNSTHWWTKQRRQQQQRRLAERSRCVMHTAVHPLSKSKQDQMRRRLAACISLWKAMEFWWRGQQMQRLCSTVRCWLRWRLACSSSKSGMLAVDVSVELPRGMLCAKAGT
jgi:hypothetical protein